MAQGEKIVPLPRSRRGSSALDFHDGNVLMTVAETYPRLLDALLEMIQNPIDAKASFIRVVVNLKRRNAMVEDDGNGASQTKFEQALTQICQTQKRVGDLGQFGRGLISPLGKCTKFTFTSCPKTGASQGYIRWTFVSKDIQGMKEISGIPFVSLPELFFSRKKQRSRKKQSFVPWRTQVRMEGIIKDRFLTKLTLDELVRAILDRYGPTMRKRGIVVKIELTDPEGRQQEKEVTAKDFEGQKLEEHVINKDDCGNTTFRLFIARRTSRGRKGRVSFGDTRSDFRIEGKKALWDSLAPFIYDHIIKALKSGVFEGEIVCQKVRIHPTRNKFVENDALLGMCLCVEQWWEEVGQHIVEEIQVESKESRYQELGLRSLKVIDQILKLEDWSDVLELFKRGTTGRGHTDLPDRGEQKHKSAAVGGTTGDKGKSKGDGEPRDRSEPPTEELPGHHPGTVQGPRGRRRKIVSRSSTGLQFCYAEIGTDPFEFDSTTGCLTFNTSHRFWFDCEEKDRALMRYQEQVAIMALTMLRFEDRDAYSNVKAAMLAELELIVFQIVHGDVLSGRQSGKYKG
jgi:hypothetical protein